MICNIDTSTTEVQPLPAPILKKSRTDLFNRSKEWDTTITLTELKLLNFENLLLLNC